MPTGKPQRGADIRRAIAEREAAQQVRAARYVRPSPEPSPETITESPQEAAESKEI